MLACFCQSGQAAVQWELAWEASDEPLPTQNTPDDDERIPSRNLTNGSASMEFSPVTAGNFRVACTSDAEPPYVNLTIEFLGWEFDRGEAIRFPGKIMKVPIG